MQEINIIISELCVSGANLVLEITFDTYNFLTQNLNQKIKTFLISKLNYLFSCPPDKKTVLTLNVTKRKFFFFRRTEYTRNKV